jgi:hypothetical protein
MPSVFVYSWLGLDDLMDQADELQVRPGSQAHKSASLYIKVLSQLRDFPHVETQAMADSLWEIVYHNLVFVSLAEPGEAMRMLVSDVEGTFQQAVIRVPEDWLELFLDDPIYQLGGVLYTGSQAVDFYNGRLGGDPNKSSDLAQAHEAEILRLASQEFPSYQLDSYQRKLLEKFPQGLNSPRAKELIYPLAPVESIEA